MKIFQLIDTPLSGVNLIEASAGTGKTYTIARLYLRLILEKGLSVDQILVVTFTKAATAELKDRIRNILLQAKLAFTTGSSTEVFVDDLLKRNENPTLTLQLLQTALIDFDKAAIFTIHGFCQRVLSENAFETRSLFDTELVTDASALTEEVAQDFWRKNFYDMPPEILSYVHGKIPGPQYFYNLYTKKQSPDTRIIPDPDRPEFNSLEDFRKSFNQLKSAWPKFRTAVMQLLRSPALSGTIYGGLNPQPESSGLTRRDLKMLSMIQAMDRFVVAKHAVFPLFGDFEKFTSTKLQSATRKNQHPPQHQLFDFFDELLNKNNALISEMERYLVYLKSRFFEFAELELEKKRLATNIQFFDDLLLTVKKALEDSSDSALADVIRSKYAAALIDEFQDTDAIQYEIFSKLFTSKTNALFFIGDPKQAIYGFRGADVFSYMKAARQADAKYTLIENWRSNPELITAINAIFSNVEEPFVFDEIPFQAGVPGRRLPDESNDAPLTLWYLAPEKEEPFNKAEATEKIAAAVSGEISRLLFSGSRAGNEPIKPGDIAVLVRTNRQARIIKTYLLAAQVPSVLFGAGNIFHSHEALELERILASIYEPTDERRLRSALVTDIMGASPSVLDVQAEVLPWWEARFRSFSEYFQQWQQYGFIHMFRYFMVREKVRERLLTLPDGERRLTNVLHLAERLHQASIEKKTGIGGLVKWLSVQIQTALPVSETEQLRLESDENAVKIATIHKSKGLEYPVVFCPYTWEGSLIQDPEVVFHKDDVDRTMFLDIDAGHNPQNVVRAQNELLAENLRLLYVALTRAKQRSYLVWGRIKGAETSALAYLLHYGRSQNNALKPGDVAAALQSCVAAKKNEDLSRELKQLERRASGTIKVLALPFEPHGISPRSAEQTVETLTARPFTGYIDTVWKISSYSHMVSQRTGEETIPDRDVDKDEQRHRWGRPSDLSDPGDIFAFPGGIRTGLLVHDIFEQLDFTLAHTEHLPQLVQTKLKAYGFDLKWENTVCTMVRKVLRTPLMSGESELTLSSLSCLDRINEMEFYFPLKSITPFNLKKVFDQHGKVGFLSDVSDRIGKLSFSTVRGFMKGFIDMIFYYKNRYFLVDWKSNLLGFRLEDYDQASLSQAMDQGYYVFQYHLYTLALHQYLRMRIPGYRYENDFGGVFYIFLRGVDPDRGADFGIYRDRPSLDIITALGNVLIPESI